MAVFDPNYMADVVEGRFAGSTRSQLTELFTSFKAGSSECLIVHFHGGLVTRDIAINQAFKINQIYSPSAATLFPIWETGLFEVLQRNWIQIAGDGLYQILIDRVARAVHQKASPPGTPPLRSLTADELRKSATGSGEIPGVSTAGWDRTAAALTPIERKAMQHTFQQDPSMVMGIRHAMAAHHSNLGSGNVIKLIEKEVAMAGSVLQSLFEEAKDLIGLPTAFAMNVIDSVDRVLERFRNHTDHGLHATVVEEILRAFYLDVLGYEIWNEMKEYINDAFGSDPERFFGTALIEEIARIPAGKRVLVVGHSAGAIYACELLQHLAARSVSTKVETIFLAPAVRNEVFQDTIPALNSNSGFRMFTMTDALERQDNLLGAAVSQSLDWFYPMSLLYFISGVLEEQLGSDGTPADYPDAPLVGMQRFYNGVPGRVVDPSIQATNAFMNSGVNRTVWSIAVNSDARLATNVQDHGDFSETSLGYGYQQSTPNTAIEAVAAISKLGF